MIPDDIRIISTLGKGKSGISYKAQFQGRIVVYKQMHEEQVSYYTFAEPKIEHELKAYDILQYQDIHIPLLLVYDKEQGYLIKEYIDGKAATEMIVDGELDDGIFRTMLEWEERLKGKNINIDYFPSNFVLSKDGIYYIDYELDQYSEMWDFTNWGMYYWLNDDGFRKFIETGEQKYITEEGTGIPVTNEAIQRERRRILDNSRLERFRSSRIR
jgi:predicted Ser/Thr protein kinase